MIHEQHAEVLANLEALTRDLKYARAKPNNQEAIVRLELQMVDFNHKLDGIKHDAATELCYMLRNATTIHGPNLRALLVEALEGAFVTAEQHADLKAGVKLLAEFRGDSR